jgi:hypothetical protein
MLASEYTPAANKTTAYFKKGTEPTETSTRYSQLENVKNLKYENGIISWDAIKTPDFIDTDYITSLFDKLFTEEDTKQEEIAKRIAYNNSNIGSIVYEIYSKDSSGNLSLITTTSDTKYQYYGNGNIVVKTAYSIFKDNRSSGSEIIVESSIITSELSGSSTINLNVGDTYTEPDKPVIVLENGNVDVTDKATITYTITKSSDNTVYDKMYYISTKVADTYTIKYKITYGNYTNTLTKIINVKEKTTN